MRTIPLTTDTGKEIIVVEVESDAINFVLDMGYLIYKKWDEKMLVTDDEIEKDAVNFLKTGRSKFAGMETQPLYKTAAIQIKEKGKILGAIQKGIVEFDCSELLNPKIEAGDLIKFNNQSDIVECSWVSNDGKSVRSRAIGSKIEGNIYDMEGTILVKKSGSSFISFLESKNIWFRNKYGTEPKEIRGSIDTVRRYASMDRYEQWFTAGKELFVKCLIIIVNK